MIQLVSFGTVCFLLGVAFVYAQVSQTHVISGGVYPGAPAYTVWFDGVATYYAKNAYGVLSFSGANAANVINDAIAATVYVNPNFGGVVELSAQIFYIDKSINLTTGVSLKGQGSDTTYLYTQGFPADGIMINVGANHRVTIEGLRLYSNAVNTTAIWAGDPDPAANAYQNTYKDLFIWNTEIGIDQGRHSDTGDYDSTYIDIRTNNVTYPFVLVSSGTTIINPRLDTPMANGRCMVFDKADGYPVGAAVNVFGGVIGASEYALEIINAQEIAFYGTWFESSTDGLVDVDSSGILYSLSFFGGRASVDAGAPYMMDFSNYDPTNGGAVVHLSNFIIEGTSITLNQVPLTSQENLIGDETGNETILTYYAPGDASFLEISGWIQVENYVGGNIYFTVDYYDRLNTSQTVNLQTLNEAGAAAVPVAAAGEFFVSSGSLYVFGGSTVTIKIVCTGAVNLEYDAAASLTLKRPEL